MLVIVHYAHAYFCLSASLQSHCVFQCFSLQAVLDALAKKSDSPMLETIGMPLDRFRKILALLHATCGSSIENPEVINIAQSAGIDIARVSKDEAAFYASFIETSLCADNADVGSWATSWANVLLKIHSTSSLLTMAELVPEKGFKEGTAPQETGSSQHVTSSASEVKAGSWLSGFCFWFNVFLK